MFELSGVTEQARRLAELSGRIKKLRSMDIVIIQGNMGGLPDRELYRIPSYLIWSDYRQVSEAYLLREEVFSVCRWALGMDARLGSGRCSLPHFPEIRVTLSNAWLRRACKEEKPSEDSARKAAEELTCELAEKFGRLPCDEARDARLALGLQK
jgi:hypothetical protein